MNKFFIWLILLCGLVSGVKTLRAVSINGRDYASLSSWAGANHLRFVRDSHSNSAVLTGRTTRLELDKDSTTAEINGVKVALSFPVAVDKGTFFIAQFDLDKTVEPLIFPPKVSSRKISTIYLDPGHGGKDVGNHTGWRYEKTYTLALASELRDQLKKAGFNVVLTRTKDKFVELDSRPDLANRSHADLFVSLHFNATETGKNEVSGAETYCITPFGASSSNAQGAGANHSACVANRVEDKSLLLAYQVQQALVANLKVKDRSVRRARFAVLRDAEMPAIMVEAGYMSHPAEGKKIFDSSYRKQIASAVVKGILAYQKLTTIPPPPKKDTVSTKKVSSVKKAK